MKIIITGINGFIGCSLALKFLKDGHSVIGIGTSDLSMFAEHKNFFYFSHKDIGDVESPLLKNADLMYCFAWKGTSGVLRGDFDVQMENARQTRKYFDLCDKINCKRFIGVGTIMEFEANKSLYESTEKLSDSYIYALGKQAAHTLCRISSIRSKCDFIWTYITNCYGVGEKSERLINTTLRKIISGETLSFSNGIQNYDFIYIDDVVRAYEKIGQLGVNNKEYMIGSGNAQPLKQYLLQILEIFNLNHNSEQFFGKLNASSCSLSLDTFSIRKLVEDTKFNVTISFEQGIIRTYEWLKKYDDKTKKE